MIAFVDAHAPWPPHDSGFNFPQFFQPTENQFSHEINSEIVEKLSRQGLQVSHLAMSENHHCTQPCSGGNCASYKAGLNEIARKCRPFKLAVSFHLDISGTSTGGPLCLYKGSDTARGWCLDFMEHIESIGPRVRRGRAPFAGFSFNGAFDVSVPEVHKAFGRKAFLEDGADDAIIVEVGNIMHRQDRIWIESGRAAKQAAISATYATRNAFAIY